MNFVFNYAENDHGLNFGVVFFSKILSEFFLKHRTVPEKKCRESTNFQCEQRKLIFFNTLQEE